MFVAATSFSLSRGPAAFSWSGTARPDKGGRLVGKLNFYGRKRIFNITANVELGVWIDDFMLDKEEALECLLEECE